MLANVPAITADLMRQMAELAGYSVTAEELQAIAKLVERSLARVDALESLPLRDVEPGVHFRMP